MRNTHETSDPMRRLWALEVKTDWRHGLLGISDVESPVYIVPLTYFHAAEASEDRRTMTSIGRRLQKEGQILSYRTVSFLQ